MNDFYWFTGVVKDVEDPLKIGRVRILIHGKHSDIQNVSHQEGVGVNIECLPWAMPIQSVTSAANGQIGTSPTGYDLETQVVGFSTGPLYENLFVIGSLAGAPGGNSDIPTSAQGETDSRVSGKSLKTGVSIAGGGSWSEPASPSSPVYPNNHVTSTKSGHLIEIDDTDGAERIHVYHKSGSSVEFHTDGAVVIRGQGDLYTIVQNDNNISVEGNINITATNCNIKANSDCNIEAGGNVNVFASSAVNLTASSLSASISGTASISANSATISSTTANISSSGTFTVSSAGSGAIIASGGLLLKGAIKSIKL